MKFAIRSYQRAETLRDKTLAVLQRLRVPPRLIYIFVADRAERATYGKVLPKGAYRELVVGRLGCYQQANFISQYFGEGEELVMMDDDVKELYLLQPRPGRRNDRKPLTDVVGYATYAFRLCERYGTRLWGVFPGDNAFMLRPITVVGWYCAPGPFYGVINTRSVRLGMGFEDLERSMAHIAKWGCMVRLNAIGISTTYFVGAGGEQASRTRAQREAQNRQEVRSLARRHPALVGAKDMDIRTPQMRRCPFRTVLPFPLTPARLRAALQTRVPAPPEHFSAARSTWLESVQGATVVRRAT